MAEPKETDPEPSAKRYKPQAYYLPVELHERFKAAWWATRDEPEPDGAGSMAIKVERLLSAEAARLEERYNAGQPFPSAPRRARGISPAGTQRQREHMEEYWSARRESGEGHPPSSATGA